MELMSSTKLMMKELSETKKVRATLINQEAFFDEIIPKKMNREVNMTPE